MKFSIITPSFNQLEHLSRCVASVHDQQGVEVEHWIQDGGSKDFDNWFRQTSSGLAQNGNKLSGISEKDQGMYDAINRGWKKADGDILCWLNCDEQYLPGALLKVKECFEANPDADIVFADVILLKSDLSPYSYRRVANPSTDFIKHCHLPVMSAGCFVRRRVVQELGHYLDSRWRAIGDAVWLCKILESGIKSVTLSHPVAVFVRTGSNLGESEISTREGEQWRAETGSTSAFLTKLASIRQHFKKLLAGAYTSRNVELAYYTDTLQQRQKVAAKIGWKW